MPQVVLELPDDVLERAESEARKRHRSTEGILTDAILSVMDKPRSDSEVRSEPWKDADLSHLSDDVLMGHIRTALPRQFQDRMSVLQERNARRNITHEERVELDEMMRKLHTNTLLKAHALVAWKNRHGSLPAQIQADFESA
jgi:hypothetical protein